MDVGSGNSCWAHISFSEGGLATGPQTCEFKEPHGVKVLIAGDNDLHVGAILHELTSSFVGSYLPVLAEKILQICSSGGRRKSTNPEIPSTTATTYFKRSSGQKQDTDKILSLKYLRVILNQILPTCSRGQQYREGWGWRPACCPDMRSGAAHRVDKTDGNVP